MNSSSTAKTILFWMFIILLCVVLWRMVSASGQSAREEEPSYSEFLNQVDRGNVKEVSLYLSPNSYEIEGELRDPAKVASGCEQCGYTGYRGRVAIFEIIRVTPEMQELIFRKASAKEITALARRQGTNSLLEDGLRKVKAGVTSLEELLRVVTL